MDKELKYTMGPGKTLHTLNEMFKNDGSGPIVETQTGERQAGILEKMGLVQQKNRSTTTSRTITGPDGVRRSVSHTESDRSSSTKISRSGYNEDGTKWEESTTSRESKQDGSGGVGRTVGAAGKTGKAAVNSVQKVLGVASDLVR